MFLFCFKRHLVVGWLIDWLITYGPMSSMFALFRIDWLHMVQWAVCLLYSGLIDYIWSSEQYVRFIQDMNKLTNNKPIEGNRIGRWMNNFDCRYKPPHYNRCCLWQYLNRTIPQMLPLGDWFLYSGGGMGGIKCTNI